MLRNLSHKADFFFFHYGILNSFLLPIDRLAFICFFQFYYRFRFKAYGKNIRWGKHFNKKIIPNSVRISCPEKISISADCCIDEGVFLQCDQDGDGIEIGSGTRINSNTHILAGSKIIIEDKVLIAPFSLISSNNHRHDLDTPIMDQGMKPSLPIRIRKGSWIGQSAIILGGTDLGENSVVAAGAIVLKGQYQKKSVILSTRAHLLDHRNE